MQKTGQSKKEGSEEMFLQSKLFTEALSPPTSHYIQSKMHSLPTESQDLKKLDLRHMCDTVVKELEVVEKEAAYDYIKVSTELEELGEELILADGIMGELEDVLFDFKSHLESIKNEMTTLQEKSNRMNTSLNNRKKLQNLLNTFIDSAVLDKDLIEAICLGEINEDYVVHIKGLLKKLSYLNNHMIAPDSKAVKQLEPQLKKLKARASVRLREFLLEQISLLKKPKTNIQIYQKNVLAKYRVFTEFFKDHFPEIFTEICNAYRETMAKVYLNNYKIYLQEIYKLQTDLYQKTDQVIPTEPNHLRPFLPQIKPTNLNQDKRSIYWLMGRERIVDQNEANDVILYNVAAQKGQKFTIQQIFKSVNKVLMDGVMNQIVFTAEFFNVKSEGAVELFGPLFRPSLNIFKENLETTVKSTHDIYGLLLILAINEKNKQIFRDREFTALDFYFDQVSMLVWPKFDYLFQFHMKSLHACSPRSYQIMQRTASSKAIIDRFSDFIVGLYRLFEYFPDSKMISSRIQTLRKTFFELQRKLKAENPNESDALNAYLNFLEQYHSALLSESNCKTPDFHNEKNRVEKEIVQISERIVRSYIKDFFPSLETFIRKYGSSEDTSEEGFSIQGGVDQKSIDGLINDLSGQSLTVSLNKLSVFCEKQYTGYSLKSLLKKFMSQFMNFYTTIHKYIKNNHSQSSSMMLQPHNMMKEIKNVFGKHLS